MIKIKWSKQNTTDFSEIAFVGATWSGTENQAARTLDFTIPWDPYYSGLVPKVSIALGDKIRLYNGGTLLFSGIVTSREKSASIGTASYTARDYMHYLLRSTVSKVIKNTTAKAATRSLCSQVGIKTTALQNPKKRISKAVYKEKAIYDIIVALYRKAYEKNKVRYMPVMKGNKLSVIKKGQASGVTLDQQTDITGATYHDTTDNMVNHVVIYSESNSKIGKQENKKLEKKYGIYMQAYTKQGDESSKEAKIAAKNLLVGVTKEASVEAIGNVKCISGRSIQISDKAAGIKGKFYISSDSHTFENDIHTMKLELVWQNTMEEGADEESKK